MSGLAQIMKNMGFRVQGSDQAKNKNIISCIKNGIKTFIGHSSKNLRGATIVVKSTAIKNNNIEIKFAKKNNVRSYSDWIKLSKTKKFKDLNMRAAVYKYPEWISFPSFVGIKKIDKHVNYFSYIEAKKFIKKFI